MAAAKTKVVVASVAAALLLGVTGTIAYQTFTSPNRARQVKVDPTAQQPIMVFNRGTLGAPLPPPVAESEWMPGFRAKYGLAPGQNVKFVPKPFIPERIGFYRKEFGDGQYQSIPEGPDRILVIDDGAAFSHRNATFGGTGTVVDGINYALNVKRWDLAGDAKLLELDMDGDWVVRKDTTPDQRMAEFLAEVSKAAGRQVTVRKDIVPREAVIIRGKFTPTARPLLPKKYGFPVVFYHGKFDAKRAGYGGGGLGDRIAGDCNIPVIDEAGVPNNSIEVHTLNSYLGNTTSSTQRSAYLDEILQHLAEQTGYEFKRETRPLPLWTIEIMPTTQPVAQR